GSSRGSVVVFFSSRRRHTRSKRDWSSDVCSSDLLVCEGNKNSPVVGVVPVTEHLSMKKLAKASGNKKCELLPLKKLVATTGYVHGANTPIGIYQKHHFPIYLDSSMKEHDQIAVSSGEVGRSIMINPDDLQKVTDATFVDLLEK